MLRVVEPVAVEPSGLAPRGGEQEHVDAVTRVLCECAPKPHRFVIGVGEHGLVALDWHSGNRSVLVDHELSGVVVGLTLSR